MLSKAYFGDVQRKAVQWTVKKAGVAICRLVNEPTAAVIAAMRQHASDPVSGLKQYTIAFDIGEGTFNIILITMQGSIILIIHSFKTISTDSNFSVLEMGGDFHCGGADWDNDISLSWNFGIWRH